MPVNSPQDTLTQSTLAVIEAFNDALNRHDIDAVMDAMTGDCVFETTFPPPDGARFEGQANVRAFWEDFLRAAQDQVINPEEFIVCGDRCTMRWVYQWTEADGKTSHIRGVDVFRVRDGKVAEKFSYVKG